MESEIEIKQSLYSTSRHLDSSFVSNNRVIIGIDYEAQGREYSNMVNHIQSGNLDDEKSRF